MTTVEVNASKKYDVLIGSGLLRQAGELISQVCGEGKIFIITDDIVDGLYGAIVEESLKSAGFRLRKYVIANGEKSKNIDNYVKILEEISSFGLIRSDAVVALGGGVVGDLAGFTAATYLRGVKFVQIPTTLLAMADSSVGGKTAINLKSGKNQAGAFYQPDLVICDYDTLKTLKAETFRDGCAEVIKHAVIRDAQLFEQLKVPLRPDSSNIEEIIAKNVTIKKNVVCEDERDTGIRQLLNFGHTIGHAIEKCSDYRITHGSAIAIGMVLASRAAEKQGYCDNCHNQILDMVKSYGLPYETDISADDLISAALSDKKMKSSNITLILPKKIGDCRLVDFDMDDFDLFVRDGVES